jgi:protein involved in polysaccharide export with SLBB domain
MMRELRLLILFCLITAAGCLSQTANGSNDSSDASPQNSTSPSTLVDCTDPTQALSPECGSPQGSSSTQERQSSLGSPERVPQLVSPFDNAPNPYLMIPPNPSQTQRKKIVVVPETEFEQIVADSAGRPLPLFGQSLFDQPPSTFAPMDLLQVPSDYIIGPGDGLQVRIWGQISANLRVVVDRSGQIYIPQVGQISVAGIHYADLEQHLKSEVSKIFRNFNLTANVSRLRSIQVLVVGDARYPGTYTISSLSTLVNAIFATGGPSPQGSLRDIQVRRDGATITHFDLYDLLIKGDKSKDVRLQPGDVIYIPHVGPLVAIYGSVNTPAIYEMKDTSTLKELIEDAGDLSNVADTGKITIDRFANHTARMTLEFPFDDQSRAQLVKDGDIVRVFSIVPRFEDTVTLRGNVANPGRYPWKPGMRIRDLIPDAQSLLTRRYWRSRAAIVNGTATEYPVRTSTPQNNRTNRNQQPTNPSTSNTAAANGATTPQGTDTTQNNNPQNELPEGIGASGNVADSLYAQNELNPSDQSPNPTDRSAGNQPSLQMSTTTPYPNVVRDIAEDVRRYAPEINWDYAIIQRVNPVDLSSKLVWMSPRKAIIEKDEASNIELQPGDIVTIFSQRDISVPQGDRSQYVIIEGEVMRPGVYKLENNETLRSVLQRAGGLSPNAYVYGSQLTRESARVDQQRSLNELAHTMEVQIRQSALAVAASSNPGDLPQMLQAQEAMITQLRSTRASGRVALPVKPTDTHLTDFPDMVMEDNDRLSIPHVPSTVSVVGDVYNPGSFIFEPRNNAGAYLEIAGKGKPQSDLHHAFVLRANGVVVAANNVNGVFAGSKFDRLRLYPGDEIVVPYKLPTGAFVRGLRDWTQISSQLALTAAALAILQ